ncbi:DUF4198 domain-containing protein [Desulfofustis glycolicus]|uniref:Uncharacterized conserved protein, contains GH25 family domain n=1 Tax=Desulfofustis glycolicus DSM 9705 TaxID=1121409 RepID=A0A1M5X214_9BACT|nr:DUF4198 domain-containing protein [Desulfofustis glycolicus]MCB2215555.1 DUF4198 domain-containing protein [Desulfobulbaceae bacterium]SHH93652.1 Uncharacterized conserved protein, contains GH25 family domain [Desulfofustis glycolicus DSM 9705]
MRQFRQHLITLLTAAAIIAGTALSAQAHFPWINMEDSNLAAGRNLKWTIGWGHRFPLSGLMSADAVGEMAIIGPDGAGKIGAEAVNDLQFQSIEGPSQPGAYIIAMSRATSFYTKTTEGSKRQSKKGLDNVLSCSRSNSFMKAIANVDGSNGTVDTVVGHAIEIVPLVNPAKLRVGDFLPFRVLYQDQPLKTEFYATYAGFSNDNGVFAYAAGTDKDGYGTVKILHSGAWLVTVSLKEPFADPEECDVESFRSALTFEIP